MKKNLIIVAILSCFGAVQAQQISIPWQCGFEDDAENANWKFTDLVAPTPQDTIDAWAIGRGARSVGKQAMYISIDGGQTATFGDRVDIVMAYRLIKFPVLTDAKEYDISFDFSLQGAETGTLYVYFDYASTLITGTDEYQMLQYANVGNASAIPQRVLNKARYVYAGSYDRTNVLRDQKKWRNVSIDAGAGTDYSERIKAGEQKEYALVFVWVNKNTDPQAQAKGACIDNIQIASATLQKPQNLSYTTECSDSSITISWDGVMSDYLIKYKNSSSTIWRKASYSGADGQIHHSYRITALRDGTYDFQLVGTRSMWDEALGRVVTDSSAQSSISNVLLYCPENQCVNYIDLDAADCAFGQEGSLSGGSAIHRKVDYGAEDVLSFHTVITDPTLYDIRTNYKVKEIPEGALASVRVGNWYSPSKNTTVHKSELPDNYTIHGQSITYSYTVDTTDAAIIMLQYALVLDQPSGHKRVEMPYFKLSILDENGVLIDGCGEQRFDCPGASDEDPNESAQRIIDEHWQHYSKEDQPAQNEELGFKGDTIWYKDWTSMGLNLSAYHGRTLKINIEVRGCNLGAHYGYGYFTLSCVSATLETDQCGTSAQATVEAPEGFLYQWYAEEDSAKFNQGGLVRDDVIVCRDQTFTAPLGTDKVYVCHLSYLDAEDCGFNLKTALSPLDIRPGFSADLQWDTTQWKCSTVVMLRDTSRVIRYMKDGTVQLTKDRGDYSNFTIRSLTDPTKAVVEVSGDRISHLVDYLGDTLEITQESYLRECSKIIMDTVVVPNITTPDSIVHDSVCSNRKYVFDGHVFDGRRFPAADTFYTATYSNQYGCDSTLSLYLRLDSATVYEVQDTVSRNQLPLIFNVLHHGDTIRKYEIGNYYDSVTTDYYVLKLINRFNCDSMINLQLTIIPELKVQVGETGELCGRKSFDLSYRITEGDFDSLMVTFSEAARQHGFRDTMFYHDPYRKPLSPFQEWEMPVAIPNTAAPDHYYADMTFYQNPNLFEAQSYRVEIDLRYDTAIIRQKWNDVLSLNNQNYNGGYTFSAYQWYEGDTPIEGQTKSYLYLPAGLDLTGKTYKALLTRVDGVQQFTCDFTPCDRSGLQISEFPTVVQVGQRIAVRVASRARISIQNMMGTVYSVTTLSAQEGAVTAPHTVGWYIVQMQLEDGVQHTQKILVTP